MLFWLAFSELSANQIVRCFKLEKPEKYMRYEDDFFLPLMLQKICCLGSFG